MCSDYRLQVKPAESLANRLKKLEEALDDLRFESKAALEQINPHVIRNRFETLESNITRIKSHTATLASADDVDDSRRTLEVLVQGMCKCLKSRSDHRAETCVRLLTAYAPGDCLPS